VEVHLPALGLNISLCLIISSSFVVSSGFCMAVRRASAFHYSVRLPQNFYLKHLIYNKEGTLLRRKLLLSGVVLSVLLCSSLVPLAVGLLYLHLSSVGNDSISS
jgi:hypothetical protein